VKCCVRRYKAVYETKQVVWNNGPSDDSTVITNYYNQITMQCLTQGRSDGGYIGIYTPQNQSNLKHFMWLFCLLAMTS